MSLNPEYQEKTERYREQQEYRQEIEDKIVERLSSGHETFPDTIVCPNLKCRNPVKVEIEEDLVRVKCSNCGWEHLVKRVGGTKNVFDKD